MVRLLKGTNKYWTGMIGELKSVKNGLDFTLRIQEIVILRVEF